MRSARALNLLQFKDTERRGQFAKIKIIMETKLSQCASKLSRPKVVDEGVAPLDVEPRLRASESAAAAAARQSSES